MADKIILAADEARALKARIAALYAAKPVSDINRAGKRSLRARLGLSDVYLPADQWFALCDDTLRVILPRNSAALRQLEAIVEAVRRDGELDAASVAKQKSKVKKLLRLAETIADLYAGTDQPEDLDLRMREAIRRDVWQSWPVRIALSIMKKTVTSGKSKVRSRSFTKSLRIAYGSPPMELKRPKPLLRRRQKMR